MFSCVHSCSTSWFSFRICVNEAEAILLGFQHYLVMLGTTVLIPSSLVPQMGGGNVRTCWMLFSLLSFKICFLKLFYISPQEFPVKFSKFFPKHVIITKKQNNWEIYFLIFFISLNSTHCYIHCTFFFLIVWAILFISFSKKKWFYFYYC